MLQPRGIQGCISEKLYIHVWQYSCLNNHFSQYVIILLQLYFCNLTKKLPRHYVRVLLERPYPAREKSSKSPIRRTFAYAWRTPFSFVRASVGVIQKWRRFSQKKKRPRRFSLPFRSLTSFKVRRGSEIKPLPVSVGIIHLNFKFLHWTSCVYKTWAAFLVHGKICCVKMSLMENMLWRNLF